MNPTPFGLRLRGRAGAAALATLVTCPFVQAQAPAAEEPVRMPTFEVSTTQDRGYRAGNSVSATRIDTPIRDLPFAVSAFTEEFITDIGARDLFDIVKYAPGVTSAGREFSAGNTRFAIRGYDQLTPQRNGFVGTSYVDTVSIQRVEVVKGPASLLYGQIAPGGTVNYITKRAQEKAFVQTGVQFGSDAFARATADVNVPTLGNRLLFRVSGAWENASEWIEPSQATTTVIAPTATWRITDRTTLRVDYENFERRENPPVSMRPNIRVSGLVDPVSRIDPGFLGAYPLPENFNYSSENDYRRSFFESLNGELTHAFGNWVARFNYNWGRTRTNHKLTGVADANLGLPAGTTAAAFAAAILANPEVALTAPTATLIRRKRLEENYGWAHAFQGELVGRIDFEGVTIKPLFGAFYALSHNNIRRRESRGNPPAGTANSATTPAQHFQPWNLKDPTTWDRSLDYDENALPATAYSNTSATDKAVYGVATVELLDDRLTLVGGARWNEAESTGRNLLTVRSDSATVDQIVPQAGAGFRLTPELLAYASYSESFVVSGRYLNTLGQIDLTRPAAPSTATGYEFGLKTDFLQGRISSTVSVYRIDQQDRILQFSQRTQAGATVVTQVQGTEDRTDGFELETTISPLENWQVYASFGYNDTSVIAAPPELRAFVGTRPEATVRELANLWTRYTFGKAAGEGLYIAGGFNYTGEKAQRVDNPNLFFPSYTLWDAVVGYDWEAGGTSFGVSVSWKNIGDEEYFPANQQRGFPSRWIASFTAKF